MLPDVGDQFLFPFEFVALLSVVIWWIVPLVDAEGDRVPLVDSFRFSVAWTAFEVDCFWLHLILLLHLVVDDRLRLVAVIGPASTSMRESVSTRRA